MYVQIDEKLITDTLSNYRELSAQITSRVEEVLKNISSDEELMQVVSMPGREIADRGEHTFCDVSDVYEAFIKLKNRQALEARMQIRELTEKQETMNRIMACFYVMPLELQELLDCLYISHKNSKEGRLFYQEKYQCDRRTVVRKRTKAIKVLMSLYKDDWDKEFLNSKKYR